MFYQQGEKKQVHRSETKIFSNYLSYRELLLKHVWSSASIHYSRGNEEHGKYYPNTNEKDAYYSERKVQLLFTKYKMLLNKAAIPFTIRKYSL